MSSISHFRKSANEKNIDDLMEDTLRWDKAFYEYSEEITFYKTMVTSDVFENKMPNLYEKLQDFYTRITKLREEKIDLQEALHNHKNDLAGMMECEDISCETFYHSQHLELAQKMANHHAEVKQFRLDLMKFATPLLKIKE